MNAPIDLSQICEPIIAYTGARGHRAPVDAYLVSAFLKNENRPLTDGEIDFLNNEMHNFVQELAYKKEH